MDVLVSIERSIMSIIIPFILKAGLINLAKNINNRCLNPPPGSLEIILGVPSKGDSRKIRAKYFGIPGFSERYMGFVGFLLEKHVLIDLI